MSRLTRSCVNEDDEHQESESEATSRSAQDDLRRKILIVEGTVMHTDQKTALSHTRLHHPRTGKLASYLLNKEQHQIYEVVNLKGEFRSWFIQQQVLSNGDVLLCSPVDSIFLLLPVLYNSCKDAYRALSQLHDCDSDLQLLADSYCSQHSLQSVADTKQIDDLQLLRYNHPKTLIWLRNKVSSVERWLLDSEVTDTAELSSSSNLLVRKRSPTDEAEERKRYACGLVCEYLCDALAADLHQELGIKEAVEASSNEEPSVKKQKVAVNPTEDYSTGSSTVKENKPLKMTQAQKKLSKVDKSGMKSMASFFAPKNK